MGSMGRMGLCNAKWENAKCETEVGMLNCFCVICLWCEYREV